VHAAALPFDDVTRRGLFKSFLELADSPGCVIFAG